MKKIFSALIAALLVGFSFFVIYGYIGQRNAIDYQRRVLLAQKLAFHGADVRDGSPDLAKRIGALAVGIHADEVTKSGLIDSIVPDLGEEFVGDGVSDALEISGNGAKGLTAGSGKVVVWEIDRKSDWRDQSYPDYSMAKKVGEFKGLRAHINSLALSSDGTLALTGASDGESRLWSLSDPARPRRLADLYDDRFAGSENEQGVDHVELVKNGNLAVTAGVDGRIAIWSLANRMRPEKLSVITAPGALRAMAVSDDGKTAVSVGGPLGRLETRVWDLTDPANPEQLAVLGNSERYVGSVSLDAGGTVLLIGGSGKYMIWNLAERAQPKLEAVVPVPISDVASVSLSADGNLGLIAGYRSSSRFSMLGYFSLWDMKVKSRPARITDLFNESSVGVASAISADGGVALTSLDAGSIWDFRDLEKIRKDPKGYVCSQVNDGYRLSRDEWNRYGDPAMWEEYVTKENGDSIQIC
ncbi:WD40 repeat domain-containing protein [Nonomuraea sp. NPDC049684]|uniref:WD40 repeat domain-containing protein n=1 Tax=Nonomuraea sp. NPDC049684 TaxID=3364356 RepID=UPI003799C4C9